MGLYTRPQVLVLLALLATAGVGLAVGQFRRAYPELAGRLERIEREVVDEAAGGGDGVGGGVPGPVHGRITPARDDDETGRWRALPRPDKRASGPGGHGAEPPLDLNAAVLDDLVRLPGVGAVLAGRILEARDAERFSSIDDLRRVRGISRSKIERLRPHVTVVADRGSASAPSASPPAVRAATPREPSLSPAPEAARDRRPDPILTPTPDRATPPDGAPPTDDLEPPVDDG